MKQRINIVVFQCAVRGSVKHPNKHIRIFFSYNQYFRVNFSQEISAVRAEKYEKNY